jgi:CBS domain-containing protein
MVPISEYATVPERSSLYDAVLALEKAQDQFDRNRYRHRAVLILDKKGNVKGKLSQLDVLRALEPKDENAEGNRELARFGFSRKFVQGLRMERPLQGEPLKELFLQAAKVKVEDFMQAPTEGEYVDLGASLEVAIHQLVLGNHLSLLVTHAGKIVGVLRLTDAFAAVLHGMKECIRAEGKGPA